MVDTLVTHPNVMNGAALYWPQSNVLYTEGYALDQFCAGHWGLLPVTATAHRIGLLLDSSMDNEARLRHLQAADAARATLGIDVASYVYTDEVRSVHCTGTRSSVTVTRPHKLQYAPMLYLFGSIPPYHAFVVYCCPNGSR